MKSADGRFRYLDMFHYELPEGTPPEAVDRFAFRCRQGGDRWCSVNLRGRGHDVPNKNWAWDGSVNAPTIAPSVNCRGCWHGYIEGGVFLTTAKVPEEKQ